MFTCFLLFSLPLRPLTQWERYVITHAQQLTETDDLIFRGNSDFLHLFNCKSNRVFVVRCHHNANFFGVVDIYVFQQLHKKKINGYFIVCTKFFQKIYSSTYLDSSQAFGQRFVIHIGSSIVWWICWIIIFQWSGTGSFLFNVRTTNQFSAKEEVLTLCLFQISANLYKLTQTNAYRELPLHWT